MIERRTHNKGRIHADKKRRHVCATRDNVLAFLMDQRELFHKACQRARLGYNSDAM